MELVIAVLVGVGIGWFWGRRSNRPAVPFTAEDDEPVTASQVALAERTNKRHDRIMEKARANGRIDNNGVEDLFCISDRTATVYLSQLTETGKLTRHGAGRGTYYVPNTVNPAE